jgi:hypothetical protein
MPRQYSSSVAGSNGGSSASRSNSRAARSTAEARASASMPSPVALASRPSSARPTVRRLTTVLPSANSATVMSRWIFWNGPKSGSVRR